MSLNESHNLSSDDIQLISAEVAGRVALYAMLSCNAYHNEPNRPSFDVKKLGWAQVDLDGNPTHRPTREHGRLLAYDIFKKDGSNEVAFAYRGSDSKLDYLAANLAVGKSIEYEQAWKEFGKYAEKFKISDLNNVVVTGHSLGGGIALGVSVRHGVHAVTFDPSPRVFDGLHDSKKPATREVVYQEGEILQFVRDHWKKVSEVV